MLKRGVNMAEYKIEKKTAPEWGMIEVLGETYEPGKPEGEEQGTVGAEIAYLVTRNSGI